MFHMYVHTYIWFIVSNSYVFVYIVVCHVISDLFSLSARLCRRCCCCCHGQPGQEIAMLNGKSTSTIMHDGRSMALQRPAWPIAKKLNIFCLRFFTHTHTHTHKKNPSSRVGGCDLKGASWRGLLQTLPVAVLPSPPLRVISGGCMSGR